MADIADVLRVCERRSDILHDCQVIDRDPILQRISMNVRQTVGKELVRHAFGLLLWIELLFLIFLPFGLDLVLLGQLLLLLDLRAVCLRDVRGHEGRPFKVRHHVVVLVEVCEGLVMSTAQLGHLIFELARHEDLLI